VIYVIINTRGKYKLQIKVKERLGAMVFNTTFKIISVISRRPVLLMEETGVPGENHGPAASH
jgi:hypothetical protein